MVNSYGLLVVGGLYACAVLAGCASAPHGTNTLMTETLMIPGGDPGVHLQLHNKRPADTAAFPAERIVLFVHGATYPGRAGFDIDLPGGSWMDYAARRGFDAYCVDVRGYGGSTRPPAMEQPPADNPPFADTKDAVRDIAAAVDFILKRRGASKLNLVGWSWGTTIVGGYAAQNPDKVHKLVLYAPLWTLKTPPPVAGAGSYRAVSRDAARARWVRAIPEARIEEILPAEWFDKWWEAALATDPAGAKQSPPVVRAPNGVIKDINECWAKGAPTWDPTAIKSPTLIILGEWDQDTPPYMAQDVFSKLTNAPYRRLELLSEGTHMMVLEKNRMRLIEQVQRFLE